MSVSCDLLPTPMRVWFLTFATHCWMSECRIWQREVLHEKERYLKSMFCDDRLHLFTVHYAGCSSSAGGLIGCERLSAVEVKRCYWPAWELKWPLDDPPFTWNWPWKQPRVHSHLNREKNLLTACEFLELIYRAFPFLPPPPIFFFFLTFTEVNACRG